MKRERPETEKSNEVSDLSLFRMFSLPSKQENFVQMVQSNKVKLEEAYVGEPFAISGFVRAIPLPNVRIVVEFTLDDWATSTQVEGCYLMKDKGTWIFSFFINLENRKMKEGDLVCMKIHLEAGAEGSLLQAFDLGPGSGFKFACGGK